MEININKRTKQRLFIARPFGASYENINAYMFQDWMGIRWSRPTRPEPTKKEENEKDVIIFESFS